MIRLLLLGAFLALCLGYAAAQTREDIVNNVAGYHVERAP